MLSSFKKIFFVLSLLTILLRLEGYKPSISDFHSIAEYNIYSKWLKTRSFSNRTPARIYQDRIFVSYYSDKGEKLTILEMKLQQNKIRYVTESFIFFEDREAIADFHFIETLKRFWYLLNTREVDLIKKFYSMIKYPEPEAGPRFIFEYQDLEHEAAIMKYLKETDPMRTEVTSLDLEVVNSEVRISFFIGEQSIFFITVKNEDIFENIEKLKINFSVPVSDFSDTTTEKAGVSAFRPPEDLVQLYYKEDLAGSVTGYLKQIDRSWAREMLHNKISDVKDFIVSEFPYHSVKLSEDVVQISIEPFAESYSSSLTVEYEEARDGVYFYPGTEFFFDKGFFGNAVQDKINLSGIQEADRIITYFNQLIFMHRSMGTKLINFMLIPYSIPTLLLLYDNEHSVDSQRQIYELQSYTDLILLLSNHWQKGRIVYFNIREVKKVSNRIEIHCDLIARNINDSKADIADIHFVLNNDLRIELVTMVLHTQVGY